MENVSVLILIPRMVSKRPLLASIRSFRGTREVGHIGGIVGWRWGNKGRGRVGALQFVLFLVVDRPQASERIGQPGHGPFKDLRVEIVDGDNIINRLSAERFGCHLIFDKKIVSGLYVLFYDITNFIMVLIYHQRRIETDGKNTQDQQ